MESVKTIKVQWSQGRFTLKVKTGYCVGDIKNLIFNKTGVLPEDQELTNLISHVREVNQTTIIRDLEVDDEDFVLQMITVHHPSTSAGHSKSAGHSNPAYLTEIENDLSLDNYNCCVPNYGVAPLPRHGKKLLVLDVDMVLYDPTAPTAASDARSRPHLHTLLRVAYEYFDILLWSLTEIETISSRLESMRIVANRRLYKILLCVGLPKKPDLPIKRTKLIRTITMKYPNYNSANVVICDTRSLNFVSNPQNGILVEPYSYENHKKDIELFLLSRYLLQLAKLPDVKAQDHRRWRDSVSK